MSDAAPPLARAPASLDFLACAVAGFAGVAAELALVRLLGPWFGQSNLVWANAVGVVLAALALGSFAGGRLADRAPTAVALAATLVPAALWFAAAAFSGPALGTWLAPSDLGGDRPLPLSFHGSLAATVILLGPPVFATGMVGPICVRRLAPRLGPGRAAGWVSAITTVGGLLACVLVPTVLVPAIGSRRVICGAGFLLGAVATAYAMRGDAVPAARATGVEGAPPSEAPRRGVVVLALAIAFVAGLAITVLEFGAVRALAPRFGQTSATYAAVIGVVIAALALGNALGGALARRDRVPAAYLRMVPMIAILMIAFLGTGSLSLPVRDRLGLTGAAVFGFGIPVLVVGVASPFLVRILARPGTVGRAAGLVFAVGTIGSLVGCYLAPLWALPEIGTKFTVLSIGCLGVLAPGLAMRLAQGTSPVSDRLGIDAGVSAQRSVSAVLRIATLTAAAVPAALLFLAQRPLRVDPGQIEERESAYQTVRVVDQASTIPAMHDTPFESTFYAEAKEVQARFLRFDEDLDSYQSLLFPPGHVGTGGRYYDHLALGAWFRGMPWNRAGGEGGVPRVLIVGYAGGTIHRVLRDTAPEGRAPFVTGVEIDPEVVALARKYLRLGELEDERLDLHVGEDGRTVLARMRKEGKFDLILVDAYQRTQYVPFHLATEEFFALCRDHLEDSGAIGINVNAPSGISGRLIRSLAHTLERAVGTSGGVWIVPNPQYPGNATVWGTRGHRPPRVPIEVPAALEVPAYALDHLLVRHDPDRDPGERWTDDRAPVERLTDDAMRTEPLR